MLQKKGPVCKDSSHSALQAAPGEGREGSTRTGAGQGKGRCRAGGHHCKDPD